MANTIYDPVMGLTIPVPTQDPGPDYANNISNNHFNIAYHKHTGQGDGYQIGAAGLNIDGDVAWNLHNITTLRSARLSNNSATLIGAQDLNCVYVANNNLYFNTSNGTAIPIIQNGLIAAFSFLQYTIQSVTSATWTVLATDVYNLLAVNVATACGINLPKASTVAPGRFYVVKDASNAAGTNNITLNVATSSGDVFACSNASTYVLGGNGGSVLIYSDGVSKWFTLSQNNFSSGETLTLQSGSKIAIGGTVLSGITFDASASSPQLAQIPASTGNGKGLVLAAQQALAAGTTGGTVSIESGSGGSGGSNGNIQLLLAGVLGNGMVISGSQTQFYAPAGSNPALQIAPWQGTPGTQNYAYTITNFNVSTTNGGSNVQFVSYIVPNNTTILLEVDWIRRTTTAPGMAANKQLIIAENNGGLSTNNVALATGAGPPAFASAADIVIATVGNNVNLSAHAASAAANQDWCIVVKALTC